MNEYRLTVINVIKNHAKFVCCDISCNSFWLYLTECIRVCVNVK
jgi:hypothetical protein